MHQETDWLRNMEMGEGKLARISSGAGEPVLLVHGVGSDLRTFRHLWPLLGEKFQSIVYSRRYYWPNKPFNEGDDNSLDRHVDDIAELLEQMELGPVHIVSHSLGGHLALLFAARYPELTRSLVTMEPTIVSLFTSFPPTWKERLQFAMSRPKAALPAVLFDLFVIQPSRRAYLRGEAYKGIRIFGHGVLGRDHVKNWGEERHAQVRDNMAVDRNIVISLNVPPVSTSMLSKIDVPQLLLLSPRSPRLFDESAKYLNELMSNSIIEKVANTSHLLHEDDPVEVANAIAKFIGSIPRKADSGSPD